MLKGGHSDTVHTLVDLLTRRADENPDFPIYAHLGDGEEIAETETFGELHRRARAIAVMLGRISEDRDRVLLLFPSGIDFIAAYFGCLYGGRLAVPLPPPRSSRLKETLEKLLAIASVAEPRVAVTTRELKTRAEAFFDEMPALKQIRWMAVEDAALTDADLWRPPTLGPDDVAFLQFTSGSTSLPKGVMLSHGNLLANIRYFDESGIHAPDSRLLTWLPPFHDLGLIYGLLTPVWCGMRCFIMPNAAFVQRPTRWLDAIAKHRITHTMAPNFAFDLCLQSATDELVGNLDLRSWEYVLNGAEPVRMESMRRFAERFGPCGFSLKAISPSWGLAEAACIVTGRHVPARGRLEPREVFVDAAALARNELVPADAADAGAVSCAGSGFPLADTELRIVDPATFRECPTDRVGEVWVRNRAVASGYWNAPEKTQEVFGGVLADDPDGTRWMRTGDLGFLRDGELFVTGRIKDVIIIRGQNHYPQDIEWTVDKCHPQMKLSAAAAFGVQVDGVERLAIVAEVGRRFKPEQHADEVFAAVRQAVAERHDLQPVAIGLIRLGSLPKTSSGKVQRAATRRALIDGGLDLRADWWARGVKDKVCTPAPAATPPAVSPAPTAEADASRIRGWLRGRIAELSGLEDAQIRDDDGFSSFGLDSASSVRLIGELEEAFGLGRLPAALAYDFPTVRTLADHLAARLAAPRTPVAETTGPTADDLGAIAVVGMDCRMPGATGPDAFWRLLEEGRSAIGELPRSRRDRLGPWAGAAEALGAAGYIDGAELFDPAFFNISPREAEQMDPQQRLLLMSTWRALENAGIPREELARSRTGVFVGISGSEYGQLALAHASGLDGHAGTGTATSIAANRISYFLNLQGPSLAVDTACSSSLVAVHLACRSLLSGECDTAIVGGVNLLLNPTLSGVLRRAGMLSPTDACHSFDTRADGYVRGEGVGVVVLRRLALAQDRSNPVLALIAGTAVAQDGRSFGLTAPNGMAQQAVIREALDRAGIPPAAVDAVEAHGTGTPLGDPIEMGALAAVLGEGRDPARPCRVGTVKANIGHLEAAAGIAGLIKAVLCLQHNRLPPLAGFGTLNPRIDCHGGTLHVESAGRSYGDGQPLSVMGVTSMGFGGTNAHVVLRRAEPPQTQTADRPGHVLCLSAERADDLPQLASAFADRIDASPGLWPSICVRATTGRSALTHRAAFDGAGPAEIAARLRSFTPLARGEVVRSGPPETAFLLTGQGSQLPGMGLALYRRVPVFRAAIDACDAVLRRLGAPDVAGMLYGPAPLDADALRNTVNAQPALFCLDYALGSTLMALGVKPKVMIGHSLGEYAAACLAGALLLEDAIGLVVARARLMEACAPDGAMVAVQADRATVTRLIAELPEDSATDLAVAAVNGPQRLTVSGGREAVERFAALCRDRKITVAPLPVSGAFHSPRMAPAIAPFRAIAATVCPTEPAIPVIGNVDGTPVAEFSADYWCRHLRGTVEFHRCIETAVEQGVQLFVEVGAQPLLTAAVLSSGESVPPVIPTLTGRDDDWMALSRACARLFCAGVRIDWRVLHEGERFAHPSLPNTRFTLTPHWISFPDEATAMHALVQPHPDNQVPASVGGPLTTPIAAPLAAPTSGPAVTAGELAALLAPLLGRPAAELDPRRSLLELGADSLILVEYVRQIADRYGVEVPMASLFEELSTLEALATHLTPLARSQALLPVPVGAAATVPAAGPAPDHPAQRPAAAVQAAAVPTTLSAPVAAPPATGWQGVLERQLEAFQSLVQAQLSLMGGAAPVATLAPAASVNAGSAVPAPAPATVPATVPATARAAVPAPGGATGTLTQAQLRHVRELTEAYRRKTAGSVRYAQEYRQVFADYRTSLGFRQLTKDLLYPLVATSGKGSRITDIDGNEYIDLTMAFGSCLLGYNDRLIVDAVAAQLYGGGFQVGPKSPLTGEAARLVAELTGCERVAFANSGTEAVMTAVRIARAVTGKTKIVRFIGSYHGHSDTVLVRASRTGETGSPIAPGVPESVAADAIVLPYGTDESLEAIARHIGDIAAVVVEPIQSRRPGLQPKEFLEKLRLMTREAGCALVFDEIITGFRLSPGGAQEFFGVQADLVTYGKVAGGGMPLGIIAGTSRFMAAIDGGDWRFGDDSKPSAVHTFFAGTFSGHPLTMAAVIAVLGHLKTQGPDLQRMVNARTERLCSLLNSFFRQEGFPIRVDRAGSLFRFVFFDNYSVEFQPVEANLFFYNMTLRGIYIWEGHTCFLSAAHSDADVDQIAATAMESARAMRSGGFFPAAQNSQTEPPAVAPTTALNRLAVTLAARAIDRLAGYPQVGQTLNVQAPGQEALLGRLIEILAKAGVLDRVPEGWRVAVPLGGYGDPSREAVDARAAAPAVGALLERCGLALPDVLAGQRAAADVLFSGEGFQLVERLYAEAPGAGEANQLLTERALEAAPRDGTVLRVLEIGGGTGSATEKLLPALSGVPCRYVFTDISAGFLPRAKAKFGQYGWVEYRTLNIETSPADQGFANDRFDLIVASNVVHSTRDLGQTLEHMNALLAQGGRIVLLECVRKQPWLDVIFGLTDGWWRGRACPRRDGYPLLTPERWQSVLADEGFEAIRVDRAGETLAVISATGIAGTEREAPMTSGQRQILVHMATADEIAPAYNECALFELEGPVDAAALDAAFAMVAARHQSLRASVAEDASRFILAPAAERMEFVDFSSLDPEPAVRKAAGWVRSNTAEPFAVAHGPLVRSALIRLQPDRHWLFIVAHHLIIDGISYGTLIKELAAIYRERTGGDRARLDRPLTLAQTAARVQTPTDAAKAYWLERFGEGVPYLDLPTDRSFPATQTFEAGRTSLRVPVPLVSEMKALCRRENVTPFMALLAVYRLLLQRWAGQDRSVIGVPVSVHGEQPGESFVGFGVNLIPLVSDAPDILSFTSYLQKTRTEFLEALNHKSFPFSELVKAVNPERDPRRPAIATVLFNYEAIGSLAAGPVTVRPVVPPVSHSKYELTLDVVADGDLLDLVLTFNADLFEQATAEKLLRRFLTIMQTLIAAPDRRLGEVGLILPEEEKGLGLNPPAPAAESCLHHLFEAQVRRMPDAPAIRCHDDEWTYRGLEERSNRIANLLAARGVAPGARVAVCLRRTNDLVATLLAVMKCGAAYVPLDPRYPADRLDAILAGSQSAALVVDEGGRHASWADTLPLIALSDLAAEIAEQPAAPPAVASRPTDLAYIIFTSGSTGTPKGVAIEHRAAASMIDWAQAEFSAAALAGTLASTSVCFDLSVFEIFLPLARGHKVILVENVLQLPELARTDDITLVNTVPSAMEELVKHEAIPATVQVINLAGEALSPALVERIQDRYPTVTVYNLYGPSEDTTYTTALAIPPGRRGAPVTIGSPIPGTQIYLLDECLNPVPPGTKGTIHVAGNGLCRGYWNSPRLTSAAFLPNPFDATPGSRMYCTGDLGRLTPTGEIEYLGRRDHQVKIRGHRIELGEIELRMETVPGVERAVAVADGSPGRQHLIAFYTSAGRAAPDLDHVIRERLTATLPHYMVPSRLVHLDAIPLTPNGKADRQKLLSMAGETAPAPRRPIEADNPYATEMAAIWRSHLQIDDIGMDDDFFALGGHSLMATRIIFDVNRRFACSLRLSDMARAPTIAGLLDLVLKQILAEIEPPVPPVVERPAIAEALA